VEVGSEVGFASDSHASLEDSLSSGLVVSETVATSNEGRRSPVLVERRVGGGGGAFDVDVNEGGLAGGSFSPNTEIRDELFLVKTGLAPICWLFRRPSGGAGGVRFGAPGPTEAANRSVGGLESMGGDLRLIVSELVFRLVGRESELIKLSNVGVGPCSLFDFPCRLFGGGGGNLPAEVAPSIARCSSASRPSRSSDVRGLSSWAGGAVSKIECCEIDAVSALELLSLTG
jgi:hypothetical protein